MDFLGLSCKVDIKDMISITLLDLICLVCAGHRGCPSLSRTSSVRGPGMCKAFICKNYVKSLSRMYENISSMMKLFLIKFP